MSNWWTTIDSFEKFFWYIAIPFSVFFLLQLLLTFLGMGDNEGFDLNGDGTADIDFDDMGGGAFQLFTIRNFLSFFTVFGWAGIVFSTYDLSKTIVSVLAFISGLIAMFIVAFLFYSMMKLGSSGNVVLKYSLGKKGKVYLPIPAAGKGHGKIQITFHGALREVTAITEGEELSRGTRVEVDKILDDDTLVVKKIGSDN